MKVRVPSRMGIIPLIVSHGQGWGVGCQGRRVNMRTGVIVIPITNRAMSRASGEWEVHEGFRV